jgi:ParB/RepB/Spo0J family partition protein
VEPEPERTSGKEAPKSRRKQPAPPIGLEINNWQDVDLTAIDLDDTTFQCRLSTSAPDLKRSLKAEGQQEPIDLLGAKPPYKIIDGFRRCAAARALGWSSMKAFVHDSLSQDLALRLAFTKNVVRKNLVPMDRAHALWIAQKKGFKKTDLAKAFGISEKQVNRYLQLLEFPKEIQKILDGKLITMAHAKVLAGFAVADAAAWKKRIEQEKLDARALKKLLRRELGKKQPGRKKTYVSRTKDSLRVSSFTVHRDSSKAERQPIIAALKQALEFLEQE